MVRYGQKNCSSVTFCELYCRSLPIKIPVQDLITIFPQPRLITNACYKPSKEFNVSEMLSINVSGIQNQRIPRPHTTARPPLMGRPDRQTPADTPVMAQTRNPAIRSSGVRYSKRGSRLSHNVFLEDRAAPVSLSCKLLGGDPGGFHSTRP